MTQSHAAASRGLRVSIALVALILASCGTPPKSSVSGRAAEGTVATSEPTLEQPDPTVASESATTPVEPEPTLEITPTEIAPTPEQQTEAPVQAPTSQQQPPEPTYRWYYLIDIYGEGYLGGGGLSEHETASINGTSYKKSLRNEYGFDPVEREYDLNRKCTKLSGVYGLEARSSSAARGDVKVLGDGNSLYYRDFAFGQSESRTLDVSNVLRLRFEMSRTVGTGRTKAYSAVGTPQVYCRF